MGFNDASIDRLLPRHEPKKGLALEWNVRNVRSKLFKKTEESSHATIVDMSLEGALIEANVDEEHEIGDRVRVRFGEAEGQVEIRHRRAGEGPVKKLLYGVRFLPDSGLRDIVMEAVGDVQGNRAELDEAWGRAN